MKIVRLALKCYCCGTPIPEDQSFALVSPAKETERAFVMLHEHAARADGYTVTVRRLAIS